MWSAIYYPATDNDPSKHGFLTEDAAWEYVFSMMCKDCKVDRQKKIDNPDTEDEFASLFPACACEWGVILTKELEGEHSETPMIIKQQA